MRHGCGCEGHPDRFAASPLLPAGPEKAAAELERCVRQLGFKGVMVNGTINGQFLDGPKFTPFFEAAEALDVPSISIRRRASARHGRLLQRPPWPAWLCPRYAGWGWHVKRPA